MLAARLAMLPLQEEEPSGHLAHWGCPSVGWYVPLEHCWGWAVPHSGQEAPRTQGRQSARLVTPVEYGWYVPGGQYRQSPMPGRGW